MAQRQYTAGGDLERLFNVGTDTGLTDEQLLARFVARRDEAAFEAVVRRHGPMVASVCRGILADPNDVQDAFQATFLVLVRKARSVHTGTSLGGWLYRVAYNLAIQIDSRAARRRRVEREAAEMAHPVANGQAPVEDELVRALYEEVNRLPDKYRLPVVLCHLEAMTHAQAAQQLGWTEGVVRGRVSRAREVLRRRLARRRLVLSAAAVASALSARSAWATPAALAPGWIDATVRAAKVVAAGGVPTGTVSAAAVGLSDRMVRSMFMTKLKLIAAALLAAGGIAGASVALVADGNDDGAIPRDEAGAAPRAAPAAPIGKSDGLSRPFEGVVVDSTSGKLAAGVAVLVRRTVGDGPAGEHRLESDAAGRFRLDLPAAWESPADARIAVDVQPPPGYVGFPYRTQLGHSTDRGIPLAELRTEHELGVPSYYGTLVLFPTKRITGKVAAPDGSPAAGIEVVACSVPLKDKASPPHRLVRRTRTGADGRFEAEVANPGPAVVYLLPERYAPRAIKRTDPEGDLGTFTLEAGVEIHGKLRDARNQPLANRWVRVGVTANRTEIDEELWNVGLGSAERWCRTIADGTFHAAPLAPGVYEASAHGPGRDELGDRMRVGEPLEACVIPQKVTVPAAGEMPRVVLRAVPHVVIEVRVADRQGRVPACRVTVPYRYTFDGKEYWDVIDEKGMVAVGGRARFFVPHGTPRVNLTNGIFFDDPTVAWSWKLPESGPLRSSAPSQRTASEILTGPHMLSLKNLETDRTLNVVWEKGVDASLQIKSAHGPLPANIQVDARHSSAEVCGAAPLAEGVYRFWGIRADTPLSVRVSAEGKAEVSRTFTLAAGRPRQVEIVFEDEK